MIAQGAVSVNGKTIRDVRANLTSDDLINGLIRIEVGKKSVVLSFES